MDSDFDLSNVLRATKESFDLSESVIYRLYDSAIEVGQEVIDEIHEGIEKSDFNKIKYAAHKLKGAAGSIRLDAMHNLAINLEKDADAKKDKDYSIELDRIKNYFVSFEKALRNAEKIKK